MNVSPILQCLPLLADILGRSYGVTVEIGGSEAYTDGRTIRLPGLPVTGHPDFIGLVRGYIDHEAAHIRCTDHEEMGKLTLSPIERHIWNIFEDWRVEAELARLFPGCGANFRWLIGHLFLNRAQPSLFPVLDWLLYAVRSWSVPALIPDRDRLETEIEALWPGMIPKLNAILERMKGHCPDSLACLDYARQVLTLLQDREQENPTKRDRNRQKGQIASTGSLSDLLQAKEGQLPEGLGQALRRHLTESITRIERASDSRISVARVSAKPVKPLDESARKDIRDAASGLRARLHGLLQASRMVRRIPSRRGRLDCHRLYGVAVNDPKLFAAGGRRRVLDTAVHLLLDSSASMQDRMALAGHCCLAVAQALDRSGLSVGITAFPAQMDKTRLPTVYPILDHGARVTGTEAMVEAAGGTPLAESLWWVLQRLTGRHEARKVVFIITDGMPDRSVLVRHVIEQAGRIGVEIYGIGIMAPQITTLLPGRSLSVEKLDELPGALFSLVGKKLLG